MSVTDSTSSSDSGTTISDVLGVTQESGLASDINWDEIIEEEVEAEEEPMDELEDEIDGDESVDSQLSAIETDLQTVASDAATLTSTSLYDDTQTVTSSDSSLVEATSTSSVGAVIGSNEVTVSQLASAASRTYVYTSPSSSTTIEIDGESLTISAGETAAEVAEAINESDDYDVYAATTTDSDGDTELVLSERSTGEQTSDDYIDVTGADDILTEDTSLASAGEDAEYTINGTSYSSSSDTVTNAIAGITLTLEGVTSSDVTITAETPAMSSTAIVSAVEQFVTDYNAALSLIQSDINTVPESVDDASDYDPNSGSLYGDVDLENMLSDLRDTLVDTYGSGTYTLLSELGITTGESDGEVSTNAIEGYLSLDSDTLESAIETNPDAVESVLTDWANDFETLTDEYAMSSTGVLAERITGNEDEITELQDRYDTLDEIVEDNEDEMIDEWSDAEEMLEELDDEKDEITQMDDALDSDEDSDDS